MPTDVKTTAALIGFGAVGRRVASLIAEGAAGPVTLVAVLVRNPPRYATDAATLGVPFVTDCGEILARRPDIVLEAGGHEAFRQHVPRILAAGVDVLAISVAALADPALLATVTAAATAGRTRLRVPSGAIAALDAISSASVGGLDRVVHTVRKPPSALLSLEEAQAVVASGRSRVLYEGSAREAAQRFPANVNVVAAVSLAGIGFDRTETRVIADPGVVHNTHELEISGYAGRMFVRVENVPSDETRRLGG